ncbi:threonine--tRNA ligase [Geodermatophilus obscurus]|uniref:Threonine--tRNA ligase n=1 Tax=Geodermatophilus obscurus (strain ATCC 25078 / DSM 43160 / JCM 3152 / CCUG 61914 / KCC A-0152 / KCTC 9177 / NBRC 13315 / NRRL B-3577 / G-20) TaxID=526225 RepID=D2S9J4_GEOOG|nr:threonine--tRNA ligase [Geodermatophilus obscurus]ADB75794.1 threonyl-tRNA synthetase [Geodermatophilus obscurus DSM 43160]
MSAAPALAATASIRVPAGTTAQDALKAAGTPLKGPDGAVVVRDLATGDLKDLAWAPEADAEVEPVPAASPEGRAVIRHSTAHVLAQAVQDLFPGTRLGIGPPVENGFYYDFAPERPFTPEDLEALEKRMQEIVKAGQYFSRREISDADAQAELAHEPFKLELIGLKGGAGEAAEGADVEVGGAQLTMYDNLDPRSGDRVWTDLCRGPHLPRTSNIPAFSLTRSAAAYWRGSEKNPQLQRVYGTAWESREAHKAHLEQVAEAERRDHRRLGAELDLFSFPDEIGSGLAVFHPKGGVVRREMEDYSRRRHEEAGYSFVNTPHITKGQLFQTSGHLEWYAEGMYPAMHLDEERDAEGKVRRQGQDYYLKPMNCPVHNLVFRSRGRSYKELPLRLFEFGTVYRYEKSGVVHGLTRARGFTQDDAHIYCTPEQMQGEIRSLLQFVLDLLADYGLEDFYLELSTRNPEKSIGSDEDWERATDALREAAEASGLDLVLDPGGAAFYAPKISVQARDAIGRTWQMSTIQVDLMLPERFGLEYTAADGTRQRPVMIHRALFGSMERFFGVLTEHYAGAFPAWLAPVQVVGIPVTDEQVGYLRDVALQLRARGIRVEVDDSDDRMQKKIRTASKQRIPFVLIAGATDAEAGAVSFRFRDGSQHNGVPVEKAVAAIAEWVAGRANTDPTAEALGPGLTVAG